MDTLDWEDILRDIREQRAVLFIGQDFLPHTEASIYLDLHKKLTAPPQNGIDYFYPQDGFFLFSTAGSKSKAQRNAVDFYKNLQPDAALLQKITEIPFRMIISVNPDKALVNAFRNGHIEPQFDYFTWRPNKKNKEIVEPTADYPLIYNLFGSIDKDDSLVLDYEDLFDHLKKLLNDENVPEIVNTILNETQTYIFLGTRLEKWYSQLLFRYLNRKENAFDDRNKNYTVRPNFLDSDTESFFKKQFNVNYFGITNEFFDDLHQRYAIYAAEQHNEFSHLAPRDRIKRYLDDNETQLALQVLSAHQHTFSELNANTLTLIKSNFAQYRYDKIRKLQSESELTVAHNKIKHAVLDFSKILDHG